MSDIKNSGGAAPIELDAMSVVRTGNLTAVSLAANTVYKGEPIAPRVYLLPSIASVPAGAQIMISNRGDSTITVFQDGNDSINDTAAPTTFALLALASVLFVAKQLDGAVVASWFTFDP